MLNTNEALHYLQQKHPELQLSLDTFYHAVHRKNLPRSEVVSKHDQNKTLHRYLFTEEQLDSLTFRAITRRKSKPLVADCVVTIYTSNDIHELEKVHGLLLTAEGVIAEIYETTSVRYSKNNVRNMQRTNALPAVGRIGRAYLYRFNDLKTIRLNPGRIKNVDNET